MKHVARRLLRSAAAAGIASLAAACIIPPAGVAPRPQESDQPAPDVSFYAFDTSPANVGSGILTYSTTRDAYTAAFEVDQRGTVRVLSPASPRDNARSEAGTSYVLLPMLHSVDREFLPASTDFSRVPFVFVLTSDTPLNLAAFGTGRDWSHTVTVGARDPDSTIASVAQWVLPDAPAYGSDFAYVGPALRPSEQEFMADCATTVDDVHDYAYYRDLWAVFTPADQRLSINPNWLYSPALSWSSYSLLPLAAYRAQFATSAFNGNCSGGALGYGGSSYAYAPYGYAPYGYDALGYSAYGLWGGYGTSGFGYGLGYPIGYGVVIGNGVTRTVAPLHIPRTPTALGTMQVVGTPSGTAPTAAGAVAAGQSPTRLGWRPFGDGRTPGDVQPLPRVALNTRLPFATRPDERRGSGQPPFGYAIARIPGGRSTPDMRQNGGGSYGHAVVQGPASAPHGGASPSHAAGGGSAAVSHASTSSSGGASSSAQSGGGGSRGGKSQ